MSELDPGRDERRKHIQEQVFQSPALYGRLLAAVALHNPVSWRYEHHLCQCLPDGGNSILRQMHGELLAEWLKFSLQQQEKDIRLWLRWLDRTPEEGTDLLKRAEKRANSLIPRQFRREPEGASRSEVPKDHKACERFRRFSALLRRFDRLTGRPSKILYTNPISDDSRATCQGQKIKVGTAVAKVAFEMLRVR
jgi:hypothetical protein